MADEPAKGANAPSACASLCDSLKNEFSLDKAKLDNMTEKEYTFFARSPWFKEHPWIFFAWRTFALLFYFGFTFYVFLKDPQFFWVFLTHWQLLVVTAFFVHATVCTWYYGLGTVIGENVPDIEMKQREGEPTGAGRGEEEVEPPAAIQRNWELMNTALLLSFFVFVLYWSLIYSGDEEADIEHCGDENDPGYDQCVEDAEAEAGPPPPEFWVEDIFAHALPYLFVSIDFFLTGAPYRILHVLHFWVFFLIYTFFTYIYTGITGEAIYAIIDYAGNPILYAVPWLLAFTFIPASAVYTWFKWKAFRAIQACAGV
mmetsp:Transcript_6480/g.8948  ORF Transcript_6480/g.8948 Transcript_6480/m.8948 type:complete len:314 (+) Transcript_6480:60-1001(+)|eukprot:CAMPEP_0184483836 /NCGR_PEP_ID=MMETSP0113_2-20130426/5507_1 /TAXON_ID=91329 /ORGANISM="Norrisiella sphaerica, Strain BC52" /LENGTH=313 /DNA_ID=CAMNT_0026864463 /DNA_START=60 /DNA_END=1001 /DNA_ORIENTATION=-